MAKAAALALAAGLAGALLCAAPASGAWQPLGGRVTLPPGFTLRLFADGVQDARFLTYSPQGDLYAGQLLSSHSAVTILPDRNHDGQADRAIRVATDLDSPNNVAFRLGQTQTVFAAGAFDQVKVYTDTRGDLSFAASAVVVPNLPLVAGQRHKTKTVSYGPDGDLYVSVGSIADDPPQADPASGIYRYAPDGSGQHLFATHLRNTVGLAWDPVDGALWGADNGSDDLGRDLPHDELNLLRDGGDYGWPYCIDRQVRNAQAQAYDCARTIAPRVLLAPHAGALGLSFYTGGSFPARYWGGVFVAYHSVQYTEQRGIWFVPFLDGQPAGPPELFAQRASPDGTTTNRFLGLAVNPYDGSLMVSDDREGRIYQIAYTGPPPTPFPAGRAPPAAAGRPSPVAAPPLPGIARTFSATGPSLTGPFLLAWFWNGGARFGAPVTDPLTETIAGGVSVRVQYLEHARFEWHPEARGTAAEVRITVDTYAGRYGSVPPAPAASTTPAAPAASPAPGATATATVSTPAPEATATPVATTSPPTVPPSATASPDASATPGPQPGTAGPGGGLSLPLVTFLVAVIAGGGMVAAWRARKRPARKVQRPRLERGATAERTRRE